MPSNPFDRFSVKPERPGTEPEITEEGVVTGEIGGELTEPVDPRLAAMSAIEAEAGRDAVLAAVFEGAAEGDPSDRAGRILDRINELRRELDRSDADPAFKRDRDQWLSDLANRLRELL